MDFRRQMASVEAARRQIEKIADFRRSGCGAETCRNEPVGVSGRILGFIVREKPTTATVVKSTIVYSNDPALKPCWIIPGSR